MFVYLITNIINGMRYVGQTSRDLDVRRKEHAYKKGCPYLLKAFKKYGEENFIIDLLFDVPNRELANEFEIEYIERYRTLIPNGYNIRTGGYQDRLGATTEETKKKIPESLKGHSVSKETRQKLAIAATGKTHTVSEEVKKKWSITKTGKTHSEETRRKISLSKMGTITVITKEHALKISLAKKGVPFSKEHLENVIRSNQSRIGSKASEETRKKMSEARMGTVVSEETRKRMSDARKGTKLSEETKKKLSEINKGKKHSEETCGKMSEARHVYWHLNRGIVKEGCKFCIEGSINGSGQQDNHGAKPV